MSENETIKKSLSCLHASDDTLEEVMKMADKTQKTTHIGRKIAVIALAACLIFALAVTASAYRNGAFDGEGELDLSTFFNIAFGTGVEGQEAFDVEVRDTDGNLLTTEHYPNIDRVEADPELARALLEPYISEQNETLHFNGYTLNIFSSVLDENGIGILYFEIENPDGIGLDKYAARKSEKTPLALTIELYDANGQRYDLHCMAERDSLSDTHALYAAYLTPFYPFDGSPLKLTFKWYGEETGEYSTVIDTEKLVPCKQFAACGVNVKISPLGMIADKDISAQSIVIHYADGSSYIVADDEHDNKVGSIIEENAVAFAFNRLVPVDDIVSVEIDP